MHSEAGSSLVKIQSFISQETDLDLMRFARERAIFEEIRTMDLESGKPKTIRIPNKSGAVRAALEEFFEGRKGR